MAKGTSLFWHSYASGYDHPVLGNFFRSIQHKNTTEELKPYNCKIVIGLGDPDLVGGVLYDKKTLVFDTEADELLFILKWGGKK